MYSKLPTNGTAESLCKPDQEQLLRRSSVLWLLLINDNLGTREARAPVLDLLNLFLHNWGRVSLRSDLLPFFRGFVRRVDGRHKGGKTGRHSRLKELWR
jgi:hypothetical protein